MCYTNKNLFRLSYQISCQMNTLLNKNMYLFGLPLNTTTFCPFFSDYSNLLHLVFSAFMTAVQCRPVLNCVVIYFRSSGIMDGMLYTFENRVPLMLRSVGGVASFINIDGQLHLNRGYYLPMGGYASLRLSSF